MRRNVIKEAQILTWNKKKAYRKHYYPLQIKGEDLIRLFDLLLMSEASEDSKKPELIETRKKIIDQIEAFGFHSSYEYFLQNEEERWRRK